MYLLTFLPFQGNIGVIKIILGYSAQCFLKQISKIPPEDVLLLESGGGGGGRERE